MESSRQAKDLQSTQSSTMFNNQFLSDVQFTFEGSEKKIFAHKFLLVTSSTVFAEKFHGEPKENLTIHLRNINEDVFEEFIRFLYTNMCNLTEDNAVLVSCLAKEYIVPSLTRKCMQFLKEKLAPKNVFTFLQQAIQFDQKELEKKSWELIELKANDAVASDAFTGILPTTLAEFLRRESLEIEEVDLFKAVLKWCEAECSRKEIEANSSNKREVLGNAIYQIRFVSMTLQQFSQITSDSALLTAEEKLFFYETLGGIEKASGGWDMSKRGKILLRCCRFGGKRGVLSPVNSVEHAIGVSFNQPVKIHGVRLLGEAKQKYHVQFEVCSDKINRKDEEKKFTSKEPSFDGVDHSRCCHALSGFDVMLKDPIEVEAGVAVHFKATIANVNQVMTYIKSGGKKTVETNGIIATFFDVSEVNSEQTTTVEQGQFHQIIFSII